MRFRRLNLKEVIKYFYLFNVNLIHNQGIDSMGLIENMLRQNDINFISLSTKFLGGKIHSAIE